MDLHIGVDATEGVRIPVLAVWWEGSIWVVDLHESVDDGPWVVCYQAGAERGQGVLGRGAVCAVDEVFIAAFAGDDVDVAGDECGGESAVFEGVEEVVRDEGVVSRWTVFVEVDACCGGNESA